MGFQVVHHIQSQTVAPDRATTTAPAFDVNFGHGLIDGHRALVNRVTRIGGQTRLTTAIEAAREAFPARPLPNSVIIGSGYGEGWVDAVSGSALAGATDTDAPLLLADPSCTAANNRSLEDEVRRIFEGREATPQMPLQVFIVGGPVAVPECIETVVDRTEVEVVRFSGATRC